MKIFFSRLSNNTFIRVSSVNGLIAIAKAFIIIISNKVVAGVIGPPGIALVGQMQNFITITAMVSSGGFKQGLTKYVAEDISDEQKISEIIGTAFSFTVLLTAISSTFIIIFSQDISQLIFKSDLYFSVFIVMAFALPFYNLNDMVVAIVNGFQLYKLYFQINITITLIGFILTVGLVIWLKDYGALLALVLTQSIVFFITFFFIRKKYWVKAFSSVFYKKHRLSFLFKYTLLSLVSALIWPIVNIIIRTYVMTYISSKDAGIWQAAQNINSYITSIAIGSFSVYLIPKLSATLDREMLRRELLNIYKVIIPISLIGFVVVYELRDFIIIMLYSREFIETGNYLLFQMIGTFFWICKIPVLNYMLAKGLTKEILISELAFATLYILLCLYLVPLYHIQGIQLSFGIYNFIYLIVNIILIRGYLKSPLAVLSK